MTTKTLFTVYMAWMARALQRRGFKIVRVAENKNKPGYSIYQFIDSAELQSAICQIIEEKKNKQ